MSRGSRWVFFEIEMSGGRRYYARTEDKPPNIIQAAHGFLRSWLTKPARKLKRVTVKVVRPVGPIMGLPPTYVTVKLKTTKMADELWLAKTGPPFVRVYEESVIERLAHSLESMNAGN